jgi:hypothetical protein
VTDLPTRLPPRPLARVETNGDHYDSRDDTPPERPVVAPDEVPSRQTQGDRIEASTQALALHIGLLARDAAGLRQDYEHLRADVDSIAHAVRQLALAAGIASEAPPPMRARFESVHDFDSWDRLDDTQSGIPAYRVKESQLQALKETAARRAYADAKAGEGERIKGAVDAALKESARDSAAAPILFFRGSIVPHVAKEGTKVLFFAAMLAIYHKFFH